MSKKKLTKEDLKRSLADLGFKEGDEISLPSDKAKSNESSTQNEGNNEGGEQGGGSGSGSGSGGGGSNNPGNKPPFTP